MGLDVPLPPDQSQLLKILTNVNAVPREVRQKHWVVLNDDVTLGFSDPDRKRLKLMQLELTNGYDVFNKRYNEFTWDDMAEMAKIRLMFDLRTDRALGASKPGVLNERSAQISQFSELRHISEDKSTQIGGRSLFSKIFGRK